MSGALDRVLKKTGRPAAGGQPSRPRPHLVVPDYQPLPLEHLPPTLAEFAVEVSGAVNCDPAFAAVPALVAAATAVGGAVAITPKKGYVQPCSLFAAAVAVASSGKSPGAYPSMGLVIRIEDGLDDAYKVATADHLEAMAAWRAGDQAGPKPPTPRREYIRVQDITRERLVEVLADSPRGVLVDPDELKTWLSSFTRYRSGGGSDQSFWLSLFDGTDVSYQRRTGEPRDIRVRRPVVNLYGGIQPDVLRGVYANSDIIGSGLDSRLLKFAPLAEPVMWSDAEVSPTTEEAFYRLLMTLRRLPFDPRQGATRVGLRLDALNLFKAFNDQCAAAAVDRAGHPTAAFLGKLPRHVLRLALVHHCVSVAAAGGDPGKGVVGGESMAAGIGLGEWFGGQAERLHRMMAMTEVDADESRLLTWVRRRGGRVLPRDLQRSYPEKYPTSDVATVGLDQLVQAGLAEWQPQDTPGGGWTANWLVLLDTPTAGTDP